MAIDVPTQILSLLGITNPNYIEGTAGPNPLLIGTAGDDYIKGLGGVDVIAGGNGDDYIEGGADIDTLSGGSGVGDLLGYFNSPAGVTVTLNGLGGALLSTGGDATGDVVLSGFENLLGSQFNDVLTGNDLDNALFGINGNDTLNGRGGYDVLWGGDGNDTLAGGADPDTLDGGTGSDTANYSTSPDFVLIDLGGGTYSNGDADGDIIVSIENVTGSNFDDNIKGNLDNNVLRGGAGDDEINSGLGSGFNGNDVLVGGAGQDTLLCGDRSATAGSGDLIVYESISDSTTAASDFIAMDKFDRIDLHLIDANGIAADGNQAFNNVIVTAFTGVAGQLKVQGGFIYADTDGDAVANMQIQCNFPLNVDNFIL